MKQKRYQYWSSEGIKWTKWFNVSDNIEEEPVQIKCKGVVLKNEYKTTDG